MAGDWMKIELELPDKPEVHSIAAMLNLDPDAVVGKLIRIWQWFDKHTTDGNAYGVTYSLPDRISGVSGFGEAMSFVGWLEQIDKTLSMPKFDRHTSKSAKARASTAKRVENHRVKSNADGNGDVTVDVTVDALPREEKRREESKPKTTVANPDGFAEFWAAYPRKVGKAQAEKSWAKQKPDLNVCLEALERDKRSPQWSKDNGQFIPHASTWLNQRRFEDEGETVAPKDDPDEMIDTPSGRMKRSQWDFIQRMYRGS